jgi:acetolactate synthase-1/2/3 large subunit
MGGYLVARALKQKGVEYIFTLCGGHIQPIYSGCAEVGIKLIDVRHEQAAVHAADGWARLTGKPGVAVVTAGPGLTNSLTGIANARRAGSPVVVIGGQAPLFQFEKGGLQEMDHLGLVAPITKWGKRVHHTSRIPEYIDMAFRQATAGRPGPVFLEVPLDILVNAEEEDIIPFPQNSQGQPQILGEPALIEKAAEVLLAATKPVIFGGSAVWWDSAGRALEELSEKIQSPIFVNGMGRGCIRFENPLLFSQSREKALNETDVLLLVGAEMDFRLGYGDPTVINPGAKIIQINIDPTEIGRNRGVEVGIVGNTRSVLKQIIDAVNHVKVHSARHHWVRELKAEEERDLEIIKEFQKSDQVPIHPVRLCHEIDEFLGRNAIVIGDGGDIVSLGARIIRARAPGHWLDPGPFGCLGVGMPFGLAARLAKPDEQVLLLSGDGSFGFNAMEIDTAVRFRLPMVVVIGNDGGWGQMRSGVEAMKVETTGSGATELGFTRYDNLVESLGGVGFNVERPEEIRPALERAFESRLPACINVKLDPYGSRQILSASRGMAG